MTPLTPAQRDALDAMTATAIHDAEAGVGITVQAGQLAEQLNSHGLRANVGCVLTGSWVQVWITVGPTTDARLAEVLTALDLVEDDTRRRAYPHGWHDVHLHGIDAPLFVLIDATAEAIPA